MRISIGNLAKVTITSSILIALIAILLSRFNPIAHATLVGLTVSITFPLTVYIPFVAGLKGGSPRGGFEGASAIIGAGLALLSPILALYSLGLPLILAIASMTSTLYFTLLQIRGRSEPHILFLYPLLVGMFGLIYSIVGDLDVISVALVMAMTFTTPLIFTVSTMSMTRNYRVPISPPRVYIPLALNLISFLALTYAETLGLLLFTLFLISHFISIGYYNFPSLLARAKTSTPLFKAVSRYIVTGHTTALVATVLLAYHVLTEAPRVIVVHTVYMGFIGSHIFLHVPLMIPFMLGIGSSKRYNPIPFALLLVATILRPVNPDLAYIGIVLSLLSLIIVIKP